MASQTYYRRNLPHIVPPGGTLFLTFRLTDSLPQAVIQELQDDLAAGLGAIHNAAGPADERATAAYRLQRAHFGRFDRRLDRQAYGPDWLHHPAVAELVERELFLLEETGALILSYCIMPNHVHLVMRLPETTSHPCARLMQRLKGRTALAANRLLGRRGAFWQHESYDHLVRDSEELARINSYVVLNPVKAGLVAEWEQWPHTFLL